MTKLQEKRNSLFAELSALIDAAETETRAFTDEESEKFDSLSKELSAIDKQIDREKEVRDLELGKPAAAADDKSPDEEQEKRAFELYLKSQVTVVYEPSGEIAKAFICSTGKASTPTRTGNYKIRAKYRWRLMIGNCYTQYASSFSSGYLLHSIPYNKRNAGTMSNASYDKLGNPASSGCVRLCFRDSKWVYDNCPIGTKVSVIDENAPAGSVPEIIPERINDTEHSGWDPTDDSPDSPYNK